MDPMPRWAAESKEALTAAESEPLHAGRITTGADGLCRIPYCQSNQTKRGHTERQKRAMLRRIKILRETESNRRPCIGCHSGIVPWNQGSDYCTPCLRTDASRWAALGG